MKPLTMMMMMMMMMTIFRSLHINVSEIAKLQNSHGTFLKLVS